MSENALSHGTDAERSVAAFWELMHEWEIANQACPICGLTDGFHNEGFHRRSLISDPPDGWLLDKEVTLSGGRIQYTFSDEDCRQHVVISGAR